MRRRATGSSTAAIGLGAVACALVACDVYDAGLLDDDVVDAPDLCCSTMPETGVDQGPPAGDLGTDAGAPPDTGPPVDDSGCALRHPPVRPVGEDGPGDEVFWWVVTSVNLGSGGMWATVGYDLDNRCTTIDSTDLECAPQPGFTPPNDGVEGVDNTFGQSFLALIDLFVPDWEQAVNEGFRDGRASILARLTGWNGELDDPVVDFALVATLPFPDGDPPPRFDGTDEYIVNLRGFAAGDVNRPLARDSNAYIADGVLVARPRDGSEIVLSGARAVVPVRLNGIILTGHIDPEARFVSGTLAGRWPIDAIFDGFVRAGICPGTETHTAAQTGLARAADLTPDGMPTPFMSCEAMSVGFNFMGVRVIVARYEMGPPDMSACDDAGVEEDSGSSGSADAGMDAD